MVNGAIQRHSELKIEEKKYSFLKNTTIVSLFVLFYFQTNNISYIYFDLPYKEKLVFSMLSHAFCRSVFTCGFQQTNTF